MTHEEISTAVDNGLIKNEVHKFYAQGIKETKRKIGCPTAYKRAWQLFCESLKEIPYPSNGVTKQ